jgi:hypothetical protein
MIRIAKPTDYEKLEELKKKIGDKIYLEYAIQQIAQTLTKEILQIDEEK